MSTENSRFERCDIMTFDELIVKNYKQMVKNYLNVNSLENYDIKMELFPQSNNHFFSIYFKLTYKFTLLQDMPLAGTVISEFCNNQKFSLNHKKYSKKLYEDNPIDFSTINYFRTTKAKIDTERYLLTIKDETNKTIDGTLIIPLQIKVISTSILTTQFAENYLIEYKFKNNMRVWYPQLKEYLLNSYNEKMLLPKREDFIYKKIESFQPYELTYKIFYEMAIRNDGARRIINALNYLYDIESMQKNEIKIDEISCRINNEENIYKISGYINHISENYKIFIRLGDCKFQCIKAIYENRFEVEIFVNKHINNLNLHIAVGSEKYQDDEMNFRLPLLHSTLMIRNTTVGVSEKNKKTIISVTIGSIKYSTDANKDGSWLLSLNDPQKVFDKEFFLTKYPDFLKPEEHQIYLSTSVHFIYELIKEYEADLIGEYLIYPDKYVVSYPEKSRIFLKRALHNSFDIQNDSKDQREDKYCFAEDEYDGYSIHQGILKNSDNTYDLSTIKQDSTRQVVDYNITNLQVNFNLPKHELMLYFSKIKDSYDNDNSILKSPLELLGEELNIEPEEIKNMNSIEWADTFYIYDNFKICEENITDKRNGIKIDLTEYHNELRSDNLEKSSTIEKSPTPELNLKNIQNKYSTKRESNKKEYYMEVDTIKSRYNFMEALIEHKKYKYLILGKTKK